MKLRCRSEGTILRASVALMWMGGKSVAETAAACAISKGYVSVIATMLRAEGMDLLHRKRGIPLGSRRKPKRSPALSRPKDRKSVAQGKRVDPGGRRIINTNMIRRPLTTRKPPQQTAEQRNRACPCRRSCTPTL